MLPIDSSVASSFVIDTVFLILIAAILAYIARMVKQPLVIAYLIAGVVLGPIGLGLVKDTTAIYSIARIGIIFLLFIVGVEIDIKKLARLSKPVIITTVAQVILTFTATYFIALAFGLSMINAVYAGIILAFSSTMVVIKLLSDEEELYTLHGRIITGILLVQDIILIFAMAVILNTTTSPFSFLNIIAIIGKGLALLAIAFIANRFVITRAFRFAAKSEELLFLVSIAVCFFFVFLAYLFGYPLAIGAFIAGITLANTPYSFNVAGRIVPLKDFFSIMFFVALGMQLQFSNIPVGLTLAFLGLTILFKPAIVFISLNLLGYGSRTPLLSAAPLLQISEFSLILIAQLQDISKELFSITIIIAGITIAITSYVIKHGNRIANIFSLDAFEKHYAGSFKGIRDKKIILFGCHRIGTAIINKLSRKNLAVVDFNPERIELLSKKGIACLYGDITNSGMLSHLNLKGARLVISTVPREEDNQFLISYLKEKGSKAFCIVTANHLHEAIDLYEAGADYVIVPHIMSGEHIANLLKEHLNDKTLLTSLRHKHLRHLLELYTEK